MIGPLIDGAIKRRKVVLGVTLIAALFGLFAYLTMPRESEADFDKDKALEDVRAKVDLARGKFPPDAEEPIIQEQNFQGEPIIGIVISGSAPERELHRIATALKERL